MKSLITHKTKRKTNPDVLLKEPAADMERRPSWTPPPPFPPNIHGVGCHPGVTWWLVGGLQHIKNNAILEQLKIKNGRAVSGEEQPMRSRRRQGIWSAFTYCDDIHCLPFLQYLKPSKSNVRPSYTLRPLDTSRLSPVFQQRL